MRRRVSTRPRITKIYYCDPRIFFSREVGSAFGGATDLLGREFFKREILEKKLNGFFETIRADLLLDELAASARRAVDAGTAEEG